MTQQYLLLDQEKHQILDQNAWWNMISSVYNFLSASTALAQALDHKYKHQEVYKQYKSNKTTLLEDTSLEETPEISEEHSNSISMPCDENDTVKDNEIVEKELINVYKMESNIDGYFEKQQEAIYSEMIRPKIDSVSNNILTDSVEIAKIDAEEELTRDTECGTVENLSDGSCFSLYSNLDSYNWEQKSKLPNTLTNLLKDEPQVENKTCSGKIGVSINCNTPEEFPESQIEIKPKSSEKCENNRCSVTWLTANTPYCLNLINPPMKTEEMQTVTNRRFNGMLKTQIIKAGGLEKIKIGENNKKNLEEDNQGKVKVIEQKSVVKKEKPKVIPKKKSVPIMDNKFKADPLETLSFMLGKYDFPKFEAGQQTKRQVVINTTKDDKEPKKVGKISKCESYAVQPTPFPSAAKISKTTSKSISKKAATNKNQGNKSAPSSKNEKTRSTAMSRPPSRRGLESKNKRLGDVNVTKENTKIGKVVSNRKKIM